MSESEVRRCPKCNGEMEEGERLFSYNDVYLRRKNLHWWNRSDEVVPLFCRNCGYIELYRRI
jgi:predicted nucleic-acid-binding Zn-ribbon protein